jgi:hypothetical protein
MAITRNHQAEYKHWQPEFTKVIDGKAVRFRDVCVHEIRMGDVEDPDLCVANPIWDWQNSDAGKFIMEHAVEKPYWIRLADIASYGHLYRIMARLNEADEVFFRLKYVGTRSRVR